MFKVQKAYNTMSIPWEIHEKNSTIQGSYFTIFYKLEQSIRELGYKPTIKELESWTLLIVDVLNHPDRYYHNTKHILDVTTDLNGISAIAAIYHDVIYLPVDALLHPKIKKILNKYFQMKKNFFQIRPDALNDWNFRLVSHVFNMSKEQKFIDQNSNNEFLSALVALHEMQEVLSPELKLYLACCLESTIPFRGSKKTVNNLISKIESSNKILNKTLLKKEANECIASFIEVANRDVSSFGEDKTNIFIYKTILLILEENRHLQRFPLYNCDQMRKSLTEMYIFLINLKSDNIFLKYKETPKTNALKKKTAHAKKLLELATDYLNVRAFTEGLLEIIGIVTGGKLPSVLLLDKSIKSLKKTKQVLKKERFKKAQDTHLEVNKLLDEISTDRNMTSLLACPLSSFIYSFFGRQQIHQQVTLVAKHTNSLNNAKSFLQGMPTDLIVPILNLCSYFAKPRQKALKSLADGL